MMIFSKVNRRLFLSPAIRLFFAVVLIIAFGVSCAPKRPFLLTDKNTVLSEISFKNKQTCAYKGRISVIYQDREEDVRFRALLDKKCTDEFDMKILGAFSRVIYDITYRYGDVKAYEKGIDSSEKISLFMKNRGLDGLILGLRFPYALPDESYDMTLTENGYLFRKPYAEIEAGSDMLIKRIKFDEVIYEYGYSTEGVSSIKLTQGTKKLEIGLQR
ncbi:hypothetical protein EP073_12900 [Geovibrio thiophilus]|uniref:Lipoprotein n=1 Tax=Geovibrio thiophilus TaxID=139438 RepID=A0A3R5Y8J1_9BACT|nr:hypothetical protein [Geovibrio thiophilus]QAR34271.1 hypothetical protein EP073_12900 [Geovibrio thiophilus]